MAPMQTQSACRRYQPAQRPGNLADGRGRHACDPRERARAREGAPSGRSHNCKFCDLRMGERVCARERVGRARTAVPVALRAKPLRAVGSADAGGPALAGKQI